MEHIKELIKKHFPENKTIRKEQEEVLIVASEALLSGKKHFIAELPTGVGKSLVAYVFAKMANELNSEFERTTITTKTKALQDQYKTEFSDIDIMKGSVEYPCPNTSIHANTRKNVRFGDYFCNNFRSKTCLEYCDYYQRKIAYGNSPLRLANNALLMSCRNRPCIPENIITFMPKKEIIIIDECHQIPNDIIAKGTLELNTEELEDLFGRMTAENYDSENLQKALMNFIGHFQKITDLTSINVDVTNDLYMSLQSNVKSLTEMFKNIKNKTLFFIKKELEEYLSYLSIMIKAQGKYICYAEIEKDDKGKNKSITYIYSPLQANSVSEGFFSKADFFLHLSATIGNVDTYTEELGIDNYTSFKCDSPFPLKNRKIVYAPCTNFNYKNQAKAIKDVAKMIDVIHEQNPGQRMVIHTSSYYYADQIKNASDNQFNIIVPKNAKDLNKYIDTKSILIGPTLYEGVDFYDERVRLNILSKLQFPSLGNHYIKTKMENVPGWYEMETLNRFIQAYGRGVRHKDDYATFIVLDSNFERYKNSKHIPDWIKKAIE